MWYNPAWTPDFPTGQVPSCRRGQRQRQVMRRLGIDLSRKRPEGITDATPDEVNRNPIVARFKKSRG